MSDHPASSTLRRLAVSYNSTRCWTIICLGLVYVCVAHQNDGQKQENVKLETPLGAISVTYFGPRKTHVDAIAIHGMAFAMKDEWVGVAEYLATTQNVRIAVPDFHSNPATNPRALSNGFAQVCHSIAPSSKVIMLGKSWGGASVARFAASHPQSVKAAVLVAPALPSAEIATTCATWPGPTLLLWARDDPVVPYARASAWQNQCRHVTLHTTDTGGHTIVTEDYKKPIVDFVRGGLK